MIGFYFTLIDSPIEQSKLEQWYGLYKRPMLSIAYDILHDYQEAEDAVHESFIKIAKHIKEIVNCPKLHGQHKRNPIW